MKFDVFISHASEDKEDVARPLAAELESLGFRVWFDECQLTIGDSLRRSIDKGLSESRFGVVILSHAFFTKEWPNMELDGLISRGDGAEKVVLPVWHEVTATDIDKFSPILAGKLAVSTKRGLPVVAKSIWEAINNSKNSPISIQSSAVEYEKKILSNLRAQMLTADSSYQLRKALYELDEHLARYPHSPEARLLKDKLVIAIQHAEPKIKRSAELLSKLPMQYERSNFGCLWAVLIGALLAFLAYLFLL